MTGLFSLPPRDDGPDAARAFTPAQEATALVICAAMLTVVHYHGMVQGLPQRWVLFGWFGVNVLCLLVVPCILIKFVWRRDLSEFGLQLGNWKWWGRIALAFIAVMVPVVALASRWPQFQSYYPRYPWARLEPISFVTSELGWLAYFFAWEFFFRGFLLSTLAPRLGTVAIFVQMIPFVMTHFPKPEAEAASAIVAGIALGYMAYYGRSFVGTWLLHWLVAVFMDAMVVLWPLHGQMPG